MLQIGNLKLKSRLILAPMAGISDLPFRLLNRKFGCELAFVEMLNVRSVGYKSRRTMQMLTAHPKDRPLGIQLLGSQPQYILKALDVLAKYEFDVLDFNAACPVKKVTRRGEGASLLKEPKKLKKILKLIVKSSPVPVTVKIRSGWDEHSINAPEIALSAQDAGVKAVFIHGRTKMQGLSGPINYSVIRQLKSALEIPVIAGGEILSEQLIQRMFDQTNCDAVAVARGALGNPWIFNGSKPQLPEIVKVMIEHLESCVDFYKERIGVMKFRAFFGWYTKGLRHIRPLREKSSRIKTKAAMIDLIQSL